MRTFAIAVAGVFLLGEYTARAVEWFDRLPVETVIPPPPASGSQTEKNEIAEILKARAAATPAQLAAAKRDSDVEDASIFASAIGPGWDLNKLPKTEFLISRVMHVDRKASSESKHYFHRARPWIVDARVQTCAPHDSGPALNSYPSGHAMLGFELGEVLASLMPNHAKAILARASLYSESRIVCGFHYRSDVTAGEQYGKALASAMLKNEQFHIWFEDAQSELKTAGLAR